MPVSVLRRALWREKVPYFGIAAGIAVAAGASMFLFPLRDGQAARENVAPMVVREAADKFKQLKAEADQAGVLAAMEADAKTSALTAMLDRRDVFQRLTADVQSLLDAAESRRKGWAAEQQVQEVSGPAFSVHSLTTRYLPPQAAAGEGDASMGGAESSPDPLGIAAFPRIECTMTLHTEQPEPDKFVREVAERWMRTLKARQGQPFVVAAPDRWVSITGEKETQGARAGLPAGETGRGGFGGVGRERGSRRIVGGEEGVVVLPDGTIGQAARRYRGAIIVGGPDGPEVVGGAAGTPQASDAAADIERLADLAAIGAAPEQTPRGTAVSGTWYIVFKPADSAAQDGGAK